MEEFVAEGERCMILLGQLDRPTDGVEDYCRYLREALRSEGFAPEIVRVRWEEIGFGESMRELAQKAQGSVIRWYLLQYTALAWSKRGFPTRILRVVQALKKKGRCAVTFHDYGPYGGIRWIDRFRRRIQVSVMRRLLRLCDLAILTVPRDQISWIPATARNVVFIPVGANLPSPEKAWSQTRNEKDRKPVVAIFSLSASPHGLREISEIGEAIGHATKEIGALQVILLGRNSEIGGEKLRAKLAGSPAEVQALGLIPGEDVVRVLGSADVLLFVRGRLTSNRGSAIAGIACGLPVIAQDGSQVAPPITEGGVALVPENSLKEFGPLLVRVLTDHAYRASLAERSRDAQARYFSWSVIAKQYAQALRTTMNDDERR